MAEEGAEAAITGRAMQPGAREGAAAAELAPLRIVEPEPAGPQIPAVVAEAEVTTERAELEALAS